MSSHIRLSDDKVMAPSMGLAMVLDGAIRILSVGFLSSDLAFSVCKWYTKRRFNKMEELR